MAGGKVPISSLESPARPGPWRRSLVAAAAALALAALGGLAASAGAQQVGGCTQAQPCVIMVQIDGLEATDVTPTRTPFLWDLAHSQASSMPLLGNRNGWIWQAPRASMTAGIGANAASTLVGGYPEQTGVPADDFHLGSEEGGARVRLGGSTVDNQIEKADAGALSFDTVLELVHTHFEGQEVPRSTAAFIGDPNLGPLIAGPDLSDSAQWGVDFAWYPTGTSESNPPSQENPQNPALCDIPRTAIPPQPEDGEEPQAPPCAASDEMTLNTAFQTLRETAAANVRMTYIELAELGRVKRADASGGADSPAPDVLSTLQKTDAALATFFNGYNSQACQPCADKWGSTVVMVTGTSGYEPTPLDKRVPNPDVAGQDLANYVENYGGGNKFELIPQGTVATVYPTGFGSEDPADHVSALADLRQKILDVDNVCEPDCIKEVLYLRSALTLNGQAANTVKEAHPDWHLDHLAIDSDSTGTRTTRPTGRSGDLLVVMEPGWGAGKALPAQSEAGDGDREIITNPYPASTGGPRNRSVAAIINGFGGLEGVRSLQDQTGTATGYYPVADSAEGSPDDPECSSRADNDPESLAANNADPSDDANATGHECQAELLDFAPTVAALMEVAMPPDQICGRLLNEAFNQDLTLRTDTDDQIDAYFAAGPVSAPAGQQYPQTDEHVTFEYNTSSQYIDITRVDCGEEETTRTSFECKLDGGPWEPCGTAISADQNVSKSLGPLSEGLHEFCMRAVNRPPGTPAGDPAELIGLPVPPCAIFEVFDFFDFDGLVRDLRAMATDYDGNLWAEMPSGRSIDRLVISGDFGRPLSGVTLTLYEQSDLKEAVERRARGKRRRNAKRSALASVARKKGRKRKKRRKKTIPKELCGIEVYKPKSAGYAAVQASRDGVVHARISGACRLTGIARFQPFKLDRGHIELRLRVPGAYSPTHVGVAVQEIVPNPLDPLTAAQCQDFFCFYSKIGSPDGGIVKVVGAQSLHKSKGLKKCKKKGKGKGKKAKKGKCKKKKDRRGGRRR